MTVSTEWPQVDSSMQAIAPPSSDDLFGADLLGDELMDIYNAAVVGGGNDNDEVMNGRFPQHPFVLQIWHDVHNVS